MRANKTIYHPEHECWWFIAVNTSFAWFSKIQFMSYHKIALSRCDGFVCNAIKCFTVQISKEIIIIIAAFRCMAGNLWGKKSHQMYCVTPEVLILTCLPRHRCTDPNQRDPPGFISRCPGCMAALSAQRLRRHPWISSCSGPTRELRLRLWPWPGLVSATPSPCWTYTRRWASAQSTNGTSRYHIFLRKWEVETRSAEA